jgi:hypothetical protein
MHALSALTRPCCNLILIADHSHDLVRGFTGLHLIETFVKFLRYDSMTINSLSIHAGCYQKLTQTHNRRIKTSYELIIGILDHKPFVYSHCGVRKSN